MSGLSNRSNKTFLTIKEGKIQVACAPGTEGAIITEKGKAFLRYTDVTGKIVGLYTREREYEGKPYLEQNIDIVDKQGTVYQLQLRVDSGYFRSMVNQIPNVDVSKEVTFSPSFKEEMYEGSLRKNYSLFLSQNGKNVGFYYTKATPHDMPEISPITNKAGKIVGWDSEDRDKFCLDLVNTTIAGKLMSQTAAILTAEDPDLPSGPEEEEAPFTPSDDDLPF